jgi:NAD(P)-dependent dehydrogenase (short-subunit alcohol dehydrogenase family)
MNSPVAIITGASAGMGKVCALEAARKGYATILICRNKQKSEPVVQEIQRITGNEHLYLFICDVSSQAEIRKTAQEIRERFPVIDLLINNAGAINSSYELTVDGIERTFATNHLAYFLLTNLLLENIKAAPQGRIINIASEGQRMGKLVWDDLQMANNYSGLQAYTNSKLMNIVFTNKLAQNLEDSNVSVHAVHPGAVRTEFGATATGIMGFLVKNFRWAFRSPEKGAETALYLAFSEKGGNTTGLYWANNKPIQPRPEALDNQALQRLWDVSNKLTNSTF